MKALQSVANEEDWASLIESYRSLVENSHWPFQPMLDFVEATSQSPLANAFYPSGSHEHLGFSLVRDYPARVRLPQVWVSYQSRSGSFEITFREYLGGPEEKTVCPPDQAPATLEQALLRLLARKAEPSAA